MADAKVIMPQMGESIFEGTITQWLKKVGDRVERDEPLFEISTDKVDSEIPAPETGTLKEILVGAGETVEINTVVATISTESADQVPPQPGTEQREAQIPPQQESQAGTPGRAALSPEGLLSSPLVRRLARENNIDLEDLRGKGTGSGGRITKRDILSYLEQRMEPASEGQPSTEPEVVKRIPMTPMRKAIAEHMVASKRISPHVATLFEADCSSIMAARARLRPEFDRSGIRLTILPFFLKAVAGSLAKFPILNSSVDNDEVLIRKSIHIGMAVAIDEGLLVPVIRDADRKNIRQLAQATADLAERARSKRLLPAEVQGGTFTVTNPGNFGGLVGIPIINQPQVAILAIGGIEKRPVVINDAIAIRQMVYLALSFDHRVVDGAVADQFMADVKKTLETWTV